MTFDIGTRPSKDAADRFVLYYDETQRKRELKEDGSPPTRDDGTEYESLVFWLVPLTGRVQRKIADEMMVVDQRTNEARMRSGSAIATRMKHGVLHVDGLSLKGRDVHTITDEVFNALPGWVINDVTQRIAELSGDTEEDERVEDFGEESPDQ